jgi:hypothetical protein
MLSLEVKNMPNDLYEAILDNARNENQTPDQAAITLLRNGLSSANKQKKKIQIIFQNIDEINLGDRSSFPSPESLIREDRDGSIYG